MIELPFVNYILGLLIITNSAFIYSSINLMRKINIAIIGLGNIGTYLFKYLNENKKILTEKNNCLPIVKYVSAQNKRKKRKIKIN